MPSMLTGERESSRWRSWDPEPSHPRLARANLTAGIAVAAVLAQALVAQVTLVLVVLLVLIGRLGRWRLAWLLLPAAAGLAWVLAAGARSSVAGYLAGVGHLLSHLAGPGARIAGWDRLRQAFTGWRSWLPAQLPVAVPLAAAEAGLIEWRAGRGGRSRPRPGAVVAARRRYLLWSTGRGELATADGGCVGIDWSTGRRAAISWREAVGGVLCTGQDASAVTATGLTLTLAAIAHRKAVIAIDLSGGDPGSVSAGPAAAIESACAGTAAPLRRFGGPGGWYDPLAAARPAGAGPPVAAQRELVLAMIDWAGCTAAGRRLCADIVSAALAVIAAAADLRPRAPVLDELTRLLQPAVLRARARELASQSPAFAGLGEQVEALASEWDADPASVAPVIAQLATLRAGPLGRWLRRAPAGPGIGMQRALAGREVVLFGLDMGQAGGSAAMIARLVLADLTTLLAGQAELGVPGDCLVWVNGCEVVPPGQLVALTRLGAESGAALVLGSAADGIVTTLASEVNVIAVRGYPPAALGRQQQPPAGSAGLVGSLGPAESLGPAGSAERASPEARQDSPLPARLLAGRHRDELAFLVREPRPRLLADCQAVR